MITVSLIEELTLGVHIFAGFVALGGGLGAFVTAKGGRRHRRFGIAYVYAMAVVSGTSLLLYVIEPVSFRLFLALVAIFSFYFAYSGYRVLSRKRPTDAPGRRDWVALGLFGVASVGLVVVGALWYLDGNGFAPVILVFGTVGTAFAAGDLRSFGTPPESGEWIGQHVTRMGAGYIAAVSAFSAVNFLFLPAVARWLWPTVLGTPLLVYLGRTYTQRFGPAEST
ncbi:hypothetical protein ACFQL1_14195 [Halomicroarcula sp. GCM10025709]|uniref:hypothetical protein n=1 Tax=Haloarcula TaxID=2237 RepID=UPI0024C4555D|nr:hypothetical protein [Halomicroarcula sp. YJ-61-S]